MGEILHEYEDIRLWVDYFLRPQSFDVKVDGKVIGSTTMIRGTP